MNSVCRELSLDHQLIGRAAACLDRLADEALETCELHVYTAIELLEFFEHFVDGAHQEKEEQWSAPLKNLEKKRKGETKAKKANE